jgi:hypothetical protein
MRIYTAHRRDAGPDLILVKEGFSWPAFFFSVLWALWHRMWLTALLIFAAEVALGALADRLALSPAAEFAVSLGILLFVGFEANDWRRRSLMRRGFDPGVPICASSLDEAEFRFLAADARAAA